MIDLNEKKELVDSKNHKCGCGSDGFGCKDPQNCECDSKDNKNDEQGMFITLTTDDGSDMKCQVLGTFDDGVEANYIALMPVGDDVVYLYGFEDNEESPILRKIETDKEYDRARTLFLELSEE